jgi:hypothetical protein
MVFTTDKPRSSASDGVFHPPWIFDKTEKCFCFELKIFFSYFACFTKSWKKCLSYPLVDATIRYKRRVFSSGKNYFLKTFQMTKKFVCMKFCFCFKRVFKFGLLCFYSSVFIASYNSFKYFVSFYLPFIKTLTLTISIVSI